MARLRVKANVQRLLDERNRLLADLEALKHKLSGLDLAISLFERDNASDETAKGTSGRGKAKELLLDLLKEVGTTGLNATAAVQMADNRGVRLARGTAAATLSRMKADGIVSYEDNRYRLKEFTRPRLAVAGAA
jgi:hypothetical protein